MKFLKGLLLSLLSLLLFLSLSIFGSVYMLKNTILDPDFVTAEINRLDMSSLAGDLFSLQVPPDAPHMAEINEVINETIADLEPWIKEELGNAIYTGYDYLLGKTQSLSLTISTQPMKDKLKENLREALTASPPPELQGMPPAMVEQYFNQFYEQLAQDIPPTIAFTESSLPPDARDMLEQVRGYLSYSQTLYQGLIVFMVLMVLTMILVSRNVKETTRGLGVTLLTFGAIGYGGILASKYFIDKGLPMGELPAALQTWLPEFINNMMAPLETFNLGVLIGGAALLVVSFVYRRRKSSDES